ncbi:Peptidase M1 membrane alanine aminopeptidase N-terminal [Trinorchestia longiramus]|nr:Peptidase M1 membrane alanine aminopeptidase N-terminal [Trinorchestia longiramus]
MQQHDAFLEFEGHLTTDEYGLYTLQHLNYRETQSPGWNWDHFNTIPLIPTYMLMFTLITSDYITVTGPGITFSVWTQLELLSLISYVLQMEPRILYYFQDYFRVTYPLDKLDVIAVPCRYARAVENLSIVSMQYVS